MLFTVGRLFSLCTSSPPATRAHDSPLSLFFCDPPLRPGHLPLSQGVVGVRHPPPAAAMSPIFGFVRAAGLAYVNSPDDNATAPTGARSVRFQTGLHYGAAVAAGSQGPPSAPPRYAYGVPSAPPVFTAATPWTPASPPGSAGASALTRGEFGRTFMGYRTSNVPPTSPSVTGDRAAASNDGAHFSELENGLGAASSSPYGNCGGGFAASSSAAGHQAPSSITQPTTGSAAYTPLSCPHPRNDAPVAQAVGARSDARQPPLDDEDDDQRLHQEGEDQYRAFDGQGSTLPTPTAAAASTSPINKRRRGAAATRCSPPSPSLTRRGGPPGGGGVGVVGGSSVADAGRSSAGGGALQHGRAGVAAGTMGPSPGSGSASTRPRGRSAPASSATPPTRAGGTSSTAAVAGGSSSAGPATAAHVVDIVRTTGVGFAGVRREITTQRKEVAIMNSQLRAVTKKIDEIAVLSDRLTASLVFQRRSLVSISGDITSVLTHMAASRAIPSQQLTGETLAAGGAAAVGGAAAGGDETLAGTEEQDPRWILDLKVCSCSTAAACGTAYGLGSAAVCAWSAFLYGHRQGLADAGISQQGGSHRLLLLLPLTLRARIVHAGFRFLSRVRLSLFSPRSSSSC